MASDVVSGEESAKSTPLLQEVPRDDFPQLVQILNEFAPASLCVSCDSIPHSVRCYFIH